MFIIDIALKNTPSMMSVQRKDAEAAKALYREVLEAMQNTASKVVLELTCEKQPDKKIAVLVSEIAAVQVSEQTGPGTTSGRPPGFFAMATETATTSSQRD
ncbi:MAG TPA: hypothetical protein IGS37_03910 [Synechococcales cyanobacterium M55_K2018_004]|nr:hypothetical protein [Synechococcales cyanobacterium M55_K2018_004]